MFVIEEISVTSQGHRNPYSALFTFIILVPRLFEEN